MTSYDYLAYLLLIAAIGVNSMSVYAQRRWKVYDRFGKNALTVHSVIIGLFWALFIGSEFLLSQSSWRLDEPNRLIGLTVMGVALSLFVAAMRQIGAGGLGNSNFFGGGIKKLRGVYLYLYDPIYWSYSLWFLGLAYVTGQKGFFVITIISVIGLIGIESRVERV